MQQEASSKPLSLTEGRRLPHSDSLADNRRMTGRPEVDRKTTRRESKTVAERAVPAESLAHSWHINEVGHFPPLY